MYIVGTQSIPSGATTVINFDRSAYDPNSNLTLGTGALYTVPVAGLYIVTLNALLATAANGVFATIFRNSTEDSRGTQFGGAVAGYGSSASAILNCLAGDTIQGCIFQNSGAGINLNTGAAGTYLAVHFLSPA